jgi:hypothetical protein
VGVEQVPDPQVAERASRRSYTARYKVAIVRGHEKVPVCGQV